MSVKIKSDFSNVNEEVWDGHVHVMPDFDNYPHVENRMCVCWPERIYCDKQTGKEVWVHNVIH